MATLASTENETEQRVSKEVANWQVTKNYIIWSCSVQQGCTRKVGYVCAGSTVILLISLFLSPLHTQTSPHRLSAVCRSTQFVTSINNFVTQRGSRPAICIVDVDWLKVWVWLLVRGRDGHYRDEHYRDTHLKCLVRGLKWTLERGYADCLSWVGAGFCLTDAQLLLTSSIAVRGITTACFLTAVYVQNYSAECSAVKYRQIFFSSPSVLYLGHV